MRKKCYEKLRVFLEHERTCQGVERLKLPEQMLKLLREISDDVIVLN
jgi:hypothetical protein